MFLSVRDMEVRPQEFKLTFPPGEFDYFDSSLRQVSPLEAEGRAELIETVDEIRIDGHLKVDLESACERCLELARFRLAPRFTLSYWPEDAAAEAPEHGLADKDTELSYYSGPGLELNDVLREQVLLALPMQRVCSEDCRGLCPHCGINRNTAPCSCVAIELDDRWSALRKLSAT